MARIRNEFRMELPIRTLFENPTIAQLTAQIAVQAKQLPGEALADVLAEVESLSDEEAQKRMTESGLPLIKNE